jgi:hypothetical protein
MSIGHPLFNKQLSQEPEPIMSGNDLFNDLNGIFSSVTTGTVPVPNIITSSLPGTAYQNPMQSNTNTFNTLGGSSLSNQAMWSAAQAQMGQPIQTMKLGTAVDLVFAAVQKYMQQDMTKLQEEIRQMIREELASKGKQWAIPHLSKLAPDELEDMLSRLHEITAPAIPNTILVPEEAAVKRLHSIAVSGPRGIIDVYSPWGELMFRLSIVLESHNVYWESKPTDTYLTFAHIPFIKPDSKHTFTVGFTEIDGTNLQYLTYTP